MYREIGRPLVAAVSFAIHVVVAGVLFAIIGSVAALLYVGSEYLEAHHFLPAVAIAAMRMLEILTFVVDSVAFSWLVLMEGYSFCLKVWAARKDEIDENARQF